MEHYQIKCDIIKVLPRRPQWPQITFSIVVCCNRYSRLRKFRSSMADACPSSSSLTLTDRKFSAHAQFDFSDWYISSWWLNLEQYFLVYHGGMISNYLQNQLYMNSTSLEKYGLQLQIWPITLYVELFR